MIFTKLALLYTDHVHERKQNGTVWNVYRKDTKDSSLLKQQWDIFYVGMDGFYEIPQLMIQFNPKTFLSKGIIDLIQVI